MKQTHLTHNTLDTIKKNSFFLHFHSKWKLVMKMSKKNEEFFYYKHDLIETFKLVYSCVLLLVIRYS